MSCVLGASSCHPVSTTPAQQIRISPKKPRIYAGHPRLERATTRWGYACTCRRALHLFLFTKCERKNNTETLLFHSRRRIVEMPWRCCFGAIPSPPLRYFTSKASYQDGSITSSNLQRRSPEDSRFFDLRLKNLPRILVKPNR